MALISNIIPTHGRRDSILAHLRAIPAQTLDSRDFEVIVSIDTDIDGTADAVAELAATIPYALSYCVGSWKNRSKARNAGASVATGDILVFNDDDTIPLPSLLFEYARYMRDGIAGMGWYSRNNDRRQRVEDDRVWLFLTGNCAVMHHDFMKLQGFDEGIVRWGSEDADFAFRLTKIGVELTYIPSAGVIPLWTTDEEVRSLETNKPYLVSKYGSWPPVKEW